MAYEEERWKQYRLTRTHIAAPGASTYCGLKPDDPKNADVKAFDTCSLPIGIKAPNGVVDLDWCGDNGWCPFCLQELYDELVAPEAVWAGPATGDWHHVFLETITEVRTPELLQLAGALDERLDYRVFVLGLGS